MRHPPFISCSIFVYRIAVPITGSGSPVRAAVPSRVLPQQAFLLRAAVRQAAPLRESLLRAAQPQAPPLRAAQPQALPRRAAAVRRAARPQASQNPAAPLQESLLRAADPQAVLLQAPQHPAAAPAHSSFLPSSQNSVRSPPRVHYTSDTQELPLPGPRS